MAVEEATEAERRIAMQHLVRNILIVLLVLSVCVASIFPASENLRRGKDLAGGVSLIYEVDLEPGDDSSEVIGNMIEVLKERVDPEGLFEISFVQQGRDRIEVTMPLPTEEVKRLRAEFEGELAELGLRSISERELERVLRSDAEVRARDIEALTGDDETLRSLVEAAAEAFDAAQEARRLYEQAVERGAAEEEQQVLLRSAGSAQIAYEEARDAALAASVDVEEVERALNLSSEGRRIRNDETGEVTELPSARALAIQRLKTNHPMAAEKIDRVVEAHDRYLANRRGLDDPNDLKRLLRGAGVLDFRIAVTTEEGHPELERLREDLLEKGPRLARASDARWFPIEDPSTWYETVQQAEALAANPEAYFAARGLIGAERDGVYYLLLYDAPGLALTETMGEWSVTDAFATTDQFGRPAIGFRMDAQGGRLLGDLTGANLGNPMAVLLDGKVYTAPTLQGRITRQGQITGNFPQREINYIKRTLAAGSLQARLSENPISEEVLGPELGADNLRKGFTSAVIALIAVAAFMLLYYFGSGGIAVFALLCNAVIILGAMSLNRAAFTLPGIAGIVLTFGMAVDANVLIYERIREELEAGLDLKTSVRLGYQKVLSTIVDANVTNLIICFVLYYTATVEIRGFAITLGIGIVATLFSALFVTRIIFTVLVEVMEVRRFPQLPTVVPALQRALTPRIDWLRGRPLFLVFSAILLSIGFGMIFMQRGELLGHQFRGGTQVEITLRESEEAGGSLLKTRQDVVDRLQAHIEQLEAPTEERDQSLINLSRAEVLPMSPEADGVTAGAFRIRTTVQDSELVRETIVAALGDWLDIRPALEFDGSDQPLDVAPVRPILSSSLGESIGRGDVDIPVEEHLGGVAIVLDNLEPPVPAEGLRTRIDQLAQQAVFEDAARHSRELIVIEGTGEAVRAAVVVASDEAISVFDDEERWRNEVAAPEWRLVQEALTDTTTLAGTQSFSGQIAATFRARAIVAVLMSFLGILIYIWVRFGSLRYSLAAIAALAHDVIAVVGLIALAEILYESAPQLAGKLLIEPFKIDLGLIAALLTIIGYSLNDTIVILDRIRENRGKLAYASREVVNSSINQCMSRTLMTSTTTLLAVLIMYIFGGEGIRSFTYALLCGVLVGTYSTVAVAAPLVWTRRIPKAAQKPERTPVRGPEPLPGTDPDRPA